jgi:hypothetical protein
LTDSKQSGEDTYTNDHVSITIEDRFTKPTPAGYSDVQMKIEVEPGMFVELQVHIPEMLIAKEGWFPGIPEKYKPEVLGIKGGLGHKYFEEYRTYPDNSKAPRKLELERLMRKLYKEAISAAKRRLASTNSSQDNGPRTSGDSGQGRLADLNGNALPVSSLKPNTPPSTATGTPSSNQNSASAEKGLAGAETEALITSSDTQSPGSVQDISGSNLRSSPGPEMDLFGGIEATITGPRAKAKRNAVEQIQKAPAKAKEAIARRVAKDEGLSDLDLFASAAISSLDAKPKKGESAPDDSSTGQPGNPVDPRLHGGQSAPRTRGARGVGTDQDLFDFSGRPSGSTGNQAGRPAAPDVQEPQAGLSGSGNGSAATDPDLGGGRSGTGRPESGNEGGQQDTGNAGKRRLTDRQRPPLNSPDRNFTIGKGTVLAEGGQLPACATTLLPSTCCD